MGVSKNSDTPKWKVYNGKLIKMDDLGVLLFLETPIYISIYIYIIIYTSMMQSMLCDVCVMYI